MSVSTIVSALLFLGWMVLNIWGVNLSNSIILKHKLYDSDGRFLNKIGFSRSFIISAIDLVEEETSKNKLKQSLKLLNLSYLFLIAFLISFFFM